MDKRKVILVVIGVLILIVGTFGITASLFSTGNKQTGLNSFKSGCLNITIENESAALSLSKSYPITDIEGIESTPYTFTIKNTCSTPTNYQINLESINEKSNTLSGDYVKVSLSSDTMDNVISTLTSNTSITPSLDNAYAAYNLYTGVLEGNSSKTYNLKEWIEYNATIEQAANKVYESRISVIANPDLTVTDKSEIKTVLANNTLTGTITGETSTVKYCATTDNICTPNTTASLSGNTISIDTSTVIPASTKTVSTTLGNLEVNKDGKGMVCSQIGNGKTYCSNPVENKRCSNTFSSLAKTNVGICEAEDDWGTSYYYRGAVDANWVQFAGFYWRIIRINGDGSIRMIYNGTTTDQTGTGTQLSNKGAYNTSNNDNAYVGYMYGTTGSSTYALTHANTNNSTIKNVLDTWYEDNLLTNYDRYMSKETGFCNDRQVDKTANSSYQGDGYGTNATIYAPLGRLNKNGAWEISQTPSFKCTNSSSDLFTVSSSSKGNKKLTYPVGLITSDEGVFAGGLGGTANSSYYLCTNQAYWTMSPSYVNTSGNAIVFYASSNGHFDWSNVNHTWGVRPVINLASDVKLTGSGTLDSPYQVI